MSLLLLIPSINAISLSVFLVFFAGFYLPSLMPAKLSETRGDAAWKLCERLRIIGTVYMFLALLSLLLWLWFPVSALAWFIYPNPWVGIILGIIVLVVPLPIWIKGLRDAGKECHTPSQESKLFGGIYNHIRHPQTLGEISWFLAIPLIVNSSFLLGVVSLFLFIYIPIMIHVEEEDLIRRYGDAYREYQKRTGAFFPKLRKPKR